METISAIIYPNSTPGWRPQWARAGESEMDEDKLAPSQSRDTTDIHLSAQKTSLSDWQTFNGDSSSLPAPAGSDILQNDLNDSKSPNKPLNKSPEVRHEDVSIETTVPVLSPPTPIVQPTAPPPLGLPLDPLAYSIRVPGTSPDIFVYPHSTASITARYHARFREIVNIFRQNTEAHPELHKHVHHIDYALRLCGPAAELAHPSILVFCRQSEFGALKSLLTHKRLRFQYSLQRSSGAFSWIRNRRTETQDATETHRPLFRLYFWRQKTPKVLLWGMQTDVWKEQASFETKLPTISSLTLCGHVVRWTRITGNTSTLGCVIQIGRDYYGITTAHAAWKRHYHYLFWLIFLHEKALKAEDCFEPLRNDSTDFECLMEETVWPSTDQEQDDYIMDEVEYLSLDGECEDANEHANPPDNPRGTDLSPEELLCLWPTKLEKAFAILKTENEEEFLKEQDLDWALIKLDNPSDWRPNAFLDPQNGHRVVFTSPVPANLPEVGAWVFIITGNRILQGTLQPTVSVLGGINGLAVAEVWTITLHANQEIRRGSSGSLVVDAVTHKIYGHVIGVNALGELYVSPLSAVLKQIQSRYPGVSVTLPEPGPILTCLTLYHLKHEHEETAEYLYRVLVEYDNSKISLFASMNGGASSSHGRRRLSMAAPESTTENNAVDNLLYGSTSADTHSHGLFKRTNHVDQIAFVATSQETHLKSFRAVQRQYSRGLRFNKTSPWNYDNSAGFRIFWEHCLLPFLIDVIHRWCGPHYVLSVAKGSSASRAQIYIVTRQKTSYYRRLIIAAHVQHLARVCLRGFMRTVSSPSLKILFSQGRAQHSVESSHASNPFHFNQPRMGDSIGTPGNGLNGPQSSTLGPLLTVGKANYWLVSRHMFSENELSSGVAKVMHPSTTDCSQCIQDRHCQEPDLPQSLLGNLTATSGFKGFTAPRLSHETYWKDNFQELPWIMMNWALVASSSSQGNLLRSLPSYSSIFWREKVVNTTTGIVPGSRVRVSSRTGGLQQYELCDIPAYISEAESGTGRATREWFVTQKNHLTRGWVEGVDSGAAAVDETTNALVGIFWGHLTLKELSSRLLFLTPINDIVDDIQEKCGQQTRPKLPQDIDDAETYSVYPTCRLCYDLHEYLYGHAQRRSSYVWGAPSPVPEAQMFSNTVHTHGFSKPATPQESVETLNEISAPSAVRKTPPVLGHCRILDDDAVVSPAELPKAPSVSSIKKELRDERVRTKDKDGEGKHKTEKERLSQRLKGKRPRSPPSDIHERFVKPCGTSIWSSSTHPSSVADTDRRIEDIQLPALMQPHLSVFSDDVPQGSPNSLNYGLHDDKAFTFDGFDEDDINGYEDGNYPVHPFTQ